MRIAHRDHRPQNVVPRLLLLHDHVGEHATVPADVADSLREVAIRPVQPVTRVMGNGELAVRVIRQAMVPRLVVRAGAMHRRIVLRHVEINGPRTERAGESLHRLVQAVRVRPIPIRREDGIFRRIVAEDVKQRVRHIGLETQRLGPVHPFQEVHHLLPTVHAAPADFPFRRELLAEALRNLAGFLEGLDDFLLIGLGVRRPFRHPASRINADHAAGPNAQLAQFAGYATRLAYLRDESLAILLAAHGRAAPRRRPNRRDH